MKIKSILFTIILGMLVFTSCTKEETTVINNYQLVKVNFNPSEFLSVDVSKIKASSRVTKQQYQNTEFKAIKPSKYFAYFIVGNQVIHKFENILEGSQQIMIEDRQYDVIVVSSKELSQSALRKYNNDAEYTQKLVYDLPVTSKDLILAGAIFNHDVRVNKNIKVTVYNPYAAVLFFNASSVKTQEDVDFIEQGEYQYLYIKNRNASDYSSVWSQGFKYTPLQTTNVLNHTESIESDKIYKFYIDLDKTYGNFTVEVGDLFKETKSKDLPGRQ